MDKEIWIIVAFICFVALYVIKKGWKSALLGRPPLSYDALDELLQRGDGINLEEKSDFTDVCFWHFKNYEGSVIYSRGKDDPPGESLDINVPGTAGIRFFFYGGKLMRLQRIGGLVNENPRLSPAANSSVSALLFRARELADEHPFTQ